MAIQKITRQPAELGSLELFAQLDNPAAGGSVSDPHRLRAVVEQLTSGLSVSLASAARLHGWRVQAMFESMLFGLGEVRLLSTEDSGDCYYDDAEGGVKPADFRLVTISGEHLLVEVKNVAPATTQRRASISVAELNGLLRYAELTGARLLIAHYWSGINVWTLVDPSRLQRVGTKASLSLPEAMMSNELEALGDRMVGTTPPLVLSLYPTEGEEPAVRAESTTTSFTIGKLTLSAGGRELRTKTERMIAFQLMFFGGWNIEEKAEIVDGRLIRYSYESRPYDPDGALAEQGFSIVTSLSSLHAMRYTFSTLEEDGQLVALRTELEAGALRAFIPADYWDRSFRTLRLWLFRVQPAKTH
jgi:Holliday junction resolvase